MRRAGALPGAQIELPVVQTPLSLLQGWGVWATFPATRDSLPAGLLPSERSGSTATTLALVPATTDFPSDLTGISKATPIQSDVNNLLLHDTVIRKVAVRKFCYFDFCFPLSKRTV